MTTKNWLGYASRNGDILSDDDKETNKRMTDYRYDLEKSRVSFRKGGRVFLVNKTEQQVPPEDLPEFFEQYDEWREQQYFAPFWLTGKPIVEKTAESIAEMKEMMGENERKARQAID